MNYVSSSSVTEQNFMLGVCVSFLLLETVFGHIENVFGHISINSKQNSSLECPSVSSCEKVLPTPLPAAAEVICLSMQCLLGSRFPS